MTNEYSSNNNHDTSDELSELRSLLLGCEPDKLNLLYERLDNSEITAEDISRILPEAVILRTIQDKKLGEAIVPTVEHALQASVKQDLNVLANAIFPIIGPAIRKAVATAFDEMVQSLNQTLEHSVSPQSFKWRLEARQTGKSFAEVVMLRTLIYRVEQVFLIHKKTGLLLQHTVAPRVAAQDPDLVSAMLTAIQDFVKDSFSVKKSDTLQSLEFGELTIWIEESPQAVLAGIIRGNAPQELRLVFQEAIEKIHLKFGKEIYDFTGETEPFTASKPYLEACLEYKYKLPKKQNYSYAWGLFGIIAIALGMWSFLTIKEQWQWNNLLQQLNSQPGIIVLTVNKQQGKHFIWGMRDPLAVDPNLLIQQTNINPKTVTTQWKPYLSFEPQFTAKRSAKLLQPPTTVSMKVDTQGVLEVSGKAPRNWILMARRLWRFIPGIIQYQDNNLIALELRELDLYKQQIEQTFILFSDGTTDVIPSEGNKLQNLILTIQKLLQTAKSLNKDWQIQIIGHATTTGTEKTNIILSQARANKILSYLAKSGINTNKISATGVGSKQIGANIKNKQSNRRVSFQVITDRGK
ncbi:OmpA family protein [Iningainema tapete]|uniref:OmpA family protein n=1 Tax=Iningainema tapete BLCC-T55 TaxID=2748662 RepID=A0A8J6XRG3_9CYAN|nr:OmpA family protein [Iningainema tapete]MBD2776974.1 OmpA family protein [Iningainema tapete BLCC-T55]